MTVNSLSNFGVPGLNGDRSAVLQPIFSNRYRTLFFNFGLGNEPAPYDMTRQTRKIGRPKLEFDEQAIYSYVSTVYVATRAEWDTITLTLFDDITNSAMRRVQNQLSKQQNFFDQTMSRAGENYKFELDLDVLAGGASAGGTAADPNIVQKHSYSGCWIKSSNLGEMTYEDANAMEIELTIRFDNVISFDQNGLRMGTYRHTDEIQSQDGVGSTGTGTGGFNISISDSGFSIGNGAFGLSVGGGGGNFGINL